MIRKSKKQLVLLFIKKDTRKLVALRTTMTFIVLKVWNNLLNQPSFLLFFSFIIRLLEFRDLTFLQHQSKTKQEKQYQLMMMMMMMMMNCLCGMVDRRKA